MHSLNLKNSVSQTVTYRFEQTLSNSSGPLVPHLVTGKFVQQKSKQLNVEVRQKWATDNQSARGMLVASIRGPATKDLVGCSYLPIVVYEYFLTQHEVELSSLYHAEIRLKFFGNCSEE